MQTLKKHWIKFTIGIYLLCILGYTIVFSILNWGKLTPLTSNELGDFLSGSFAPLAFFILIMGYIQQGEELQQNTAALQLQADELRNSVEQQKLLLETAKEELTITKDQNQAQYQKEITQAQPFLHLKTNAIKSKPANVSGFNLSDDKYSNMSVMIRFNNTRALARELTVKVKWGDKVFNKVHHEFLDSNLEGKRIELSFKYPEFFNGNDVEILEYIFTYLDALDNLQEQVFQVEVKRDINSAELSTSYTRVSRTY